MKKLSGSLEIWLGTKNDDGLLFLPDLEAAVALMVVVQKNGMKFWPKKSAAAEAAAGVIKNTTF